MFNVSTMTMTMTMTSFVFRPSSFVFRLFKFLEFWSLGYARAIADFSLFTLHSSLFSLQR